GGRERPAVSSHALLQGSFESIQRPLESPVEMGLHQEPGLERGRRREDPMLRSGPMEASEPGSIHLGYLSPTAGTVDPEEHAEHPADMSHQPRSSGPLERTRQPIGDT